MSRPSAQAVAFDDAACWPSSPGGTARCRIWRKPWSGIPCYPGKSCGSRIRRSLAACGPSLLSGTPSPWSESAPCGSSHWRLPFRICFPARKWRANFSIRRFNVHSVATATLVELLSEEVPFEAGGDAFLAGLLHDIGKLLIAVSFAAAVRRDTGAPGGNRRHPDRGRARRHRDRSRGAIRVGRFPMGTV